MSPPLILLIVLLSSLASSLSAEYVSQPKLQPHDGSLIVHAANDKNITLRMTGDATLLVNDVNLLDVIRKRLTPHKLAGDESSVEDALNPHIIGVDLQLLKRDLDRMTTRLTRAQNNTRSVWQQRRIRRFLGRVRRVSESVATLESNLAIDECAQQPAPCRNGGTCYDLYKNFYCDCTEGWTGKSCEEDVNECYILAGSDLGCQNNAVCINTPGSYSCNCTNGFSGTHCLLRSAVCDSATAHELCGVEGVCVQASNPRGFTCICNQGWLRDNVTTACTVDVDECEASRNPCHSECINLPGSFKCAPCPAGYTGNGLSCLDIDECAVDNGGCSTLPSVQCINTEGSYHCGYCPPGWLGDGRKCEQAPSNSCDAENICHPRATCNYISGTAVCTCPPGWYGHGFGATGCTSEVQVDPCEQHQCQNNGTCIIAGRGTHCLCPLGFIGPQCERNDACNPNPCRNNGVCNLLPGNKFRCACARGTTGNTCEAVRNTCGSIINQAAGEFTYPPDGSNYETNERCAWIIRTGSTQILNVTFSRFDLEESPDCGKDWLQIHDGRSLAEQLIGRFCGKTLPLGGNIVSSQQQLFLWFRSDNATNGGGLKMSWTSQAYSCGGVFDLKMADSGVIRSPGYPGKTPENRECTWLLNAPYGSRLLLHFYDVNLGGNENCTRDTFKIYDSDELLDAMCTTQRPEPKHTSSNLVRLHLHTDANRADSSFQLHYEVVSANPNCGGLFTEPSGVFSGNHESHVCLYLIQQPPGTKIQLEFTNLIFPFSSNCEKEGLQIFDGKTDEAPVLKQICVTEQVEPIISSSNYMLVRYKYGMAGILLPYTFTAKYGRICNMDYYGPDGGIIQTPNYPNPYFDHMTCTYNIYGLVNSVVHVNFTDFMLSESVPDISESTNQSLTVDDTANYVDVFLSNDRRQRYYKGEPMQLVSTNNRMRIVFHSDVNQHRSRGLRIEYHFEKTECGGVLTDIQGSFSNQGERYRNPKTCEWILEAPVGKSIKLSTRFYYTGPSCRPEDVGKVGLLIYLNSTVSGDKLAGSYCDHDRRVEEVYHTNILTVMLKLSTNLYGGLYNFWANYSFVDNNYDCGGNYSYRFGVIKTPNWPKNYPNDVDCIWILTAPLGHKMELKSQNFTLETTASVCRDDYLEIRNGATPNSPLIGKYCGLNMPPRIPSFTNQLYLRFHSDFALSEQGFHMTWEQTATGCGGKLNSNEGSIHSPHYPEISNDAIICDWHITVSQGSRIQIQLTKTLNGDQLCRNNVLTIYDGPKTQGRIIPYNCSDKNDYIMLTSSSNEVAVRYALPKYANDGQQFLLDYSTDCVRSIELLQGVIESPNFPDNYPPNMNCAWDIRAGRNNKISLSFSNMKMEQIIENPKDNQNLYDYVEVVDMRDEDIISTRYFVTNPPDILKSEGNRLLVKFVTDYSGSAQGFRAEFRRLGCGEHLLNEFGSIASPNAPYSVDVECDWYIEAPPGKQIVLNVYDLHIDTKSSADCSTDMLVVANEKNATLPLLKECRVEQPITVTSMANSMYIHFHTSDVRERKYFKATYSTRDARCGGVFRGNSGTITTPNYPEKYAPKSMCVWTISVENSYGINFHMEYFDLPNSTNCLDTWFEVELQTPLSEKTVLRACQIFPVTTFRTYSNRATIKFQAGDLMPHKGFQLKYEKICGGHLTASSGYIKSRFGESCAWVIDEPLGTHISVDILHLECQCTERSNCTDGLIVTPDEITSSTTRICSNPPANLIVHGNSANIVSDNVNFIAKYSSVQNSCGGVLTSVEGRLASPYYPSTYPSNIECIWEIQATKSNFLELTFEMLNIVSSERCNDDFLEIRTSESGPLLGLYCSNELPTETIITFERVWIKFRSTEGSTGEGFKLHWNYAHMNSLNATQGIIESPPVASVLTLPYVWRITLPHENLISLNFLEYHKGLNLFDGYDDMAQPVEIMSSPWEFTSSTSALFIRSDTVGMEKFEISWKSLSKAAVEANKTIAQCHADILLPNNARVNVSSVGYPKSYKNNLDCDWLIKVQDPTTHAVLHLFDADLEETTQCTVDSLTVYASSNLRDWHKVLKICQKPAISPAVVHGTPNLKLKFQTDASVHGRGFTSLLSSACGSNMTGPVGSIILENIFRSHVYNSSCLWHIEVRPGTRIEFSFSFKSTTLNPQEPCSQYAIIYDGVDENAAMLDPGLICNRIDRKVQRVVTSTNHATLRYNISRNPRETQLNQWNLTYREIRDCGGEVILTDFARSVNISSPRYPNIPQPHTECTWVVLAPLGETIQVNFVDRFDMSVRYCEKEFIEFYDGTTPLAHHMGRFCRRTSTQQTSGNALYVRYLTDIAEPRNGFRINVSISGCGGTYMNNFGDISSTNYPTIGGYPAHSTCDYYIKIPIYSNIKLNFTDLHLPFDARNLNESDHIEVYPFETNGDQSPIPIAILYGNDTELPLLELYANEVLVRFKTYNANPKYRGFKLKFDRFYGTNCNKEVSGDSGILQYTWPGRGSQYLICQWRISVPKGRRVRLEFINLERRQTTESTEAETTTERSELNRHAMRLRRPSEIKLTMYNNPNFLAKITEFTASSYNSSEVIRSTDNIMIVQIELGNGLIPALRNIRARYSSNEESLCPEDIGDSSSGSISLEKITASAENLYCQLNFVLSGHETIAFHVTELSIAGQNVIRGPQSFAVRFKDEKYIQPFNILSSNTTNSLVAFAPKNGFVGLLQTEAMRILKFEATYRRYPCGGELTLEDGFVLNSSNTLEFYNGRLDCVWLLNADTIDGGYRLLGNIELTQSCEEEYIVLYGGMRTDFAQLARICRDSGPFNGTVLRNKYTTLVYHADNFKDKTSRFSFTAESSFECGSRRRVSPLLDRIVVVDAKKYKNNSECSWEFEASPGFFMSLSFPGRFFIEDSANCSKDYLEIQRYEEGIWLTDARYCGRDVPATRNYTAQQIRLIFRTDDAITSDGFKFQVAASCSATLLVTSTTQVLRTAEIRNLRIRKMHCEYTLISDTNEFINVRLMDQVGFMSVSTLGRCELYSITAFKRDENNETLEGIKYCGDAEIRARKYLRLSFDSKVERPLRIEYKLDTCGGVVNTPGNIRSMSGENSDEYIANMNCVWNVTAPAGYSIVVKFKYFEMEQNDECRFDYVAVYSGMVIAESKLVDKICGNQTQKLPVIFVDGNQAVISAISDFSSHYRGFQAQILFTRNCNERISLTDGNSPVALVRNLTLNATEELLCRFRIMAPNGYRVRLGIRNLQLTNGLCASNRCESCNNIEVFDGVRSQRASLGKYCVSGRSMVSLMSAYEDASMLVSITRAGQYSFEIDLQMEQSVCGGHNDLTLTGGEVSFWFPPNRTLSYPPNTHCTWHISSADEDLQLEFNEFSLQNVSEITGKCLDYLSIRSTYSRVSKIMCGNAKGFSIILPKIRVSSADITFHSDALIEAKGFHVTVKHRRACNRTYTETSGMISYTQDYNWNGTCSDEIRVPENYTLTIYVPNLYFIKESTNCTTNYLMLTDINTNQKIYNNCRNSDNMAELRLPTTTNTIRVDHAATYVRLFYVANRNTSPPGCGGEIYSPEGEFSNPPYDTDRNHSECRWDIVMPTPIKIRIIFYKFDMGSPINCLMDYLHILEIRPDGSERVEKTFCGQTIPNDYISQNSHIAIVAKKSPIFDGTGWKIMFETTEEPDKWN